MLKMILRQRTRHRHHHLKNLPCRGTGKNANLARNTNGATPNPWANCRGGKSRSKVSIFIWNRVTSFHSSWSRVTWGDCSENKFSVLLDGWMSSIEHLMIISQWPFSFLLMFFWWILPKVTIHVLGRVQQISNPTVCQQYDRWFHP